MTEPEPNGWELMRSINALRESVDKLAAGMVTQATLAIYTAAQKETDARQDARLKQLETDRVEDRNKEEARVAEARKTKAQQWFAIGMAGLTGVIGIIGGVIVFSINQGGVR